MECAVAAGRSASPRPDSRLSSIEGGPASFRVRYLRFQKGDTVAYGILEEDRIRVLTGSLFDHPTVSGATLALDEVRILPPTVPTQVLALAGNYRSHLGQTDIPPKQRIPQPFFKSPSSLVGQGDPIVIPEAARDIHFEGELVIVIGKRTSKVSQANAPAHIFGVTCGNDVSERVWQKDPADGDVQWWRAKGSDTFGPVGPCIATDLDYDRLLLTLRLNGTVTQSERTDHMIHNVAAIVSFISQHITLHPGDLIFTGTPGKTSPIRPGDSIEIELEGVGTLRNPVIAEAQARPGAG